MILIINNEGRVIGELLENSGSIAKAYRVPDTIISGGCSLGYGMPNIANEEIEVKSLKKFIKGDEK